MNSDHHFAAVIADHNRRIRRVRRVRYAKLAVDVLLLILAGVAIGFAHPETNRHKLFVERITFLHYIENHEEKQIETRPADGGAAARIEGVQKRYRCVQDSWRARHSKNPVAAHEVALELVPVVGVKSHDEVSAS